MPLSLELNSGEIILEKRAHKFDDAVPSFSTGLMKSAVSFNAGIAFPTATAHSQQLRNA